MKRAIACAAGIVMLAASAAGLEAACGGCRHGFSFDDGGDFSTGVQGSASEARITIRAMSAQPVMHSVHLKPDKTLFPTADSIRILAVVTQVISRPFYPMFYLILPSGERTCLKQGNRLAKNPRAYLGKYARKTLHAGADCHPATQEQRQAVQRAVPEHFSG